MAKKTDPPTPTRSRRKTPEVSATDVEFEATVDKIKRATENAPEGNPMSEEQPRDPNAPPAGSDVEKSQEQDAPVATERQPPQIEAEPPRHDSTHGESRWVNNVIAAANWRSPRAILDALIVIFIFGVMFATCQYTNTAQMAQRPWVGVAGMSEDTLSGDPVNQKYTLVTDMKIDIGVVLRNYGNSPALHAATNLQPLIGVAPPADVNAWTTKTLPKYDCRSQLANDYGPMFPSGYGSFHYTDHEPEASRPVLSPVDFNDIVTGDKGLFVLGCVRYEDQWGNLHYTDYCLYLVHPLGSPTGSLQYCPKGNAAN
ncbi:MAG: hypothetical protein WAN81_19650 [Candidatus Binataceae bacterium]